MKKNECSFSRNAKSKKNFDKCKFKKQNKKKLFLFKSRNNSRFWWSLKTKRKNKWNKGKSLRSKREWEVKKKDWIRFEKKWTSKKNWDNYKLDKKKKRKWNASKRISKISLTYRQLSCQRRILIILLRKFKWTKWNLKINSASSKKSKNNLTNWKPFKNNSKKKNKSPTSQWSLNKTETPKSLPSSQKKREMPMKRSLKLKQRSFTNWRFKMPSY